MHHTHTTNSIYLEKRYLIENKNEDSLHTHETIFAMQKLKKNSNWNNCTSFGDMCVCSVCVIARNVDFRNLHSAEFDITQRKMYE